MNRLLLPALASLFFACSPPTTSGNDAAAVTDAASDVVTADRADSGGGTSNYGRCGMSIFADCVCGSSNRLEISNCVLGSTSASMTCQQYVIRAVQACCPDQLQAEIDCETAATTAPEDGGAAPCAETDNACVSRRCMTTNRALAQCIAQGTSSSACDSAWRTATGSADPDTDTACQ